ncbi:MAG: ATP-binding cassette domain-containing protein, partial [Cellulomonadaceae bacterium]
LVGQELHAPPGWTVGHEVAAALAGVREAARRVEAAAESFDHTSGALAELAELIARAEHLAAWDADRRVDEALTRLGACRDLDRELSALSVGERHRVRLACVLAGRPDLLLLDEPTNHLDEQAIDYLTVELAGWHGAVLIVTHDRQLIDDTVTGVLDLDPSIDGRPVLYGQPGYLEFRFAKDRDRRRWRQRFRAETKRRAVLADRLDASYEGLSDEWRPPKGSNKHRRGTRARIHVKAADRLVERLEAEAVEVPPPPKELAFPDLPALDTTWPVGAGLSLVEVRSPLVPGRLDLPGTRIAIAPSGRLLVTGANGAGKSTLLGVLTGTIAATRGARTAQGGLRIGVVGQERLSEPDNGAATGFDLAARRALRLLDSGDLDPEQVVAVAGLGLLEEADLDRPVRELSVGQRRRLDLALALVAAPHLVVLDEPTNHLSIDLVDELTQALRRTSAAVVVATHDRRMREELADWPRVELGR